MNIEAQLTKGRIIMKNYYLYLIRHGLTQGNLDGKYIGQTDLALCPDGENEIRRLADSGVYPDVERGVFLAAKALHRNRRDNLPEDPADKG